MLPVFCLNMTSWIKCILLGLCIGIAWASLAASDTALPSKGETYFTQHSFFHKAGNYITSNRRDGTLVPINSEVKFIRLGGNQIMVSMVPSGSRLIIINVQQVSGTDAPGIFKRMFSKTKVDLSKFTEKERKHIRLGTLAAGMSKEATILAMGLPSVNKDASPNRLTYWKDRNVNYDVIFNDNKIIDVRPPHHYDSGNAAQISGTSSSSTTRLEPFIVRYHNTNVYDGETVIATLPQGTRVYLVQRSGDFRLVQFTYKEKTIWGWLQETDIRVE